MLHSPNNPCLCDVVKDELGSTFCSQTGLHLPVVTLFSPQWSTCVGEFLLMLQIIIWSRPDTKKQPYVSWAHSGCQLLANGYLVHMALVYTRRGTDKSEHWQGAVWKSLQSDSQNRSVFSSFFTLLLFPLSVWWTGGMIHTSSFWVTF